MESIQTSQERSGLRIYLLVANLWTWALWIPPLLIAIRQELVLPSPDNYARLAAEGFAGNQHGMLALMFSLAVYGPLVAACIATAFERGSTGVSELLKAIFQLRSAPIWYLVALAIAAALAFVPAVVGWVSGGLTQPVLDLSSRILLFFPLLGLQLLTSGLGEEPGWRGYLLPRLQKRLSVERSVWVLGFIWAVWHYPLTSIYVWQSVPENTPLVGALLAVIIALAGQTMGLIGLTYIYVWLFNRTNNIFLMIVFHALTNILPFLVPPPQGAWALFSGFFPWIIVLALQRLLGQEQFPGKPAAVMPPATVRAYEG